MELEQVDLVTVPTRDRARADAFYPGEAETPLPLPFRVPAGDGGPFEPTGAGLEQRAGGVATAVEKLRRG